jgi:hypothetical protein
VASGSTYRAKRPDRLDEKLRQRNTESQYSKFQSISSDIKDLAGVRIALYFPGDQRDVEKIIKDAFVLIREKAFPDGKAARYPKQFDGYHAVHYLVRLKAESVGKGQQRYSDARIEIQVASVLMHAWAEVEHDLVYKPLSGRLSGAEYDILDELNGLVLTGEIALRRLQAAITGRVNTDANLFTNHYELAAFLHRELPLAQGDGPELPIGRIDRLFQLLKQSDRNSPAAVRPLLRAVITDPDHDRPVADQLIDLFIGTNKHRYQTYEMIRALTAGGPGVPEQDALDRDQAMGAFLNAWIRLERALRQRTGTTDLRFWDAIRPHLSSAEAEELTALRRLRNQIVHGIEIPSSDYLRSFTQRVQATTRGLIPHSTRKRRRKKK